MSSSRKVAPSSGMLREPTGEEVAVNFSSLTKSGAVAAKRFIELNDKIREIEREQGKIDPLPISTRFSRLETTIKEDRSPEARLADNANLVCRADVSPPADEEALRKMMRDNLHAGRWTIDPRNSEFTGLFDQAIAVALLYTALVTPYEIGFLAHLEGRSVDPLFVVGNLVNIVFVVDLGLNFFLQYEKPTDHGNMMEGSHAAIVRRYLCTGFAVDFVSSVPWGIVEMAVGRDSGGRLSVLRLLRLLRLLKLLRIVRGSRLIEKYRAEVSFSFAWITLCVYVFVIVLFAHWVACLWGYAASGHSVGSGEGWIAAQGLDGAAPFDQYVVAIYFAVMTITTVGYGDVTPTTRDEYMVVTLVMIAGGFLWAYVIGGICNVVSSMNVDRAQFKQDFDRINSMLEDLGMPHKFCIYVRKYLFNAEAMLRRNTYGDLISLLTPHQQREISVHRSKANLAQIPYFRDCSPECVLKVYSALSQMVYAPQETMELPHTLYIIANSGIVAKGGMVYSRGSCLSADFILDSDELLDTSCGTALTFVQVETLHRDTLDEVLAHFPKDRKVVRRAKIRLSFMRKIIKLAHLEKAQRAAAERVAARRERAQGKQLPPLTLGLEAEGSGGGSGGSFAGTATPVEVMGACESSVSGFDAPLPAHHDRVRHLNARDYHQRRVPPPTHAAHLGSAHGKSHGWAGGEKEEEEEKKKKSGGDQGRSGGGGVNRAEWAAVTQQLGALDRRAAGVERAVENMSAQLGALAELLRLRAPPPATAPATPGGGGDDPGDSTDV